MKEEIKYKTKLYRYYITIFTYLFLSWIILAFGIYICENDSILNKMTYLHMFAFGIASGTIFLWTILIIVALNKPRRF